MEAIFIKADGTETKVSPENGAESFSLKELQGFVGGYIEFVRFPNNKILVVNEEGKLNKLPLNVKATAMYLDNIGPTGDWIVVDVLLADNSLIN